MKRYINNKNIQDAMIVLALSFGLGIYSLVNFYTADVKTEWKMSPYLFPLLISAFAVLISFSLLADGRHELQLEKKEGTDHSTSVLAGFKWKEVLIVVGLCAAYYILMKHLGFVIASIAFLISMFLLLGERRWWLITALSVATTGIVYLLFAVALNVRLP